MNLLYHEPMEFLVILMNWDGELYILQVQLGWPVVLNQQDSQGVNAFHLEMLGFNPPIEGFEVYHWSPPALLLWNQECRGVEACHRRCRLQMNDSSLAY